MSRTVFHNIAERVDVKVFPMSSAQEGLWFLDQLESGSAAYNIPVVSRLRRLLDVEALQRSLNAIVQRHEALCTTFRLREGHPVQVIDPSLTIPLPMVDLRSLPEAEREAQALRMATEEAQRPFDLTQGPLVRATVLQLGAEEDVLLLTMHHIVCDKWSVGVLLRELATLYEAFSAGLPSPLPELPIQYADFAAWQRESLQGDILAEHLSYWKQQLAGCPAGLDLPTDRPRLQMPTSQGSTHRFTLSKALTDGLKELSRQQGATLYMTLVAAFQTLLHRYTGRDDLLIGTVTAGRTRVGTEALIGLFENTLALRTDLSGNPTFGELLGRVCKIILEAQGHQELPFEHLVKELRPERQVGQNPLFQVSLTLEPSLPDLPSEWTPTQMEIETGTSKFDLSLYLEDRTEGLLGRFTYSTDLFDETTIMRMAGHWQMLLEGVVADPTQRIATLSLLTDAELHQQLVEWNTTRAAYPADTCVHQLFEAQVERTPEAVAVVFQGEQLTYRQLNQRANQLAHYLRELGVGPGMLVGLCVERSLDMVVGLLGIFKAGGAYVPLDPSFPSERLAFMLDDAQAPVLVTQQHLAAYLPTRGTKVVCLDTDQAVLALRSETNLLPTVTSADLAYVIYTSGSTGRPKGVQIIHRAVVNLLFSMREQPGLGAEDTLLAVTTLSFDIAALELFLPLVIGARVIVASRDVVVDGMALMETLTRTCTTVMQATPVTWRLLLTAGWQGNHLLKILCGGEALPLELAQLLLPKVASLWNLYGPTETTIWSSACEIKPGKEPISIGRPIANTQIYLLDGHLQPVPVGVPGELFIGGDGLARGYLNRPELTAERFIPHPFSDESGARLYRTGDLARYRVDGTIEHLGRLDFQVKIRGFRIELGEIETVLGQHPAVRQAVVVAREDVPGDKRLVAYLVLRGKQTETVEDLKDHVMKQLPAYMVPSAYMLMDALPLTPNGKIDRRALPTPEPSRSTAKDTYVAPTLPLHCQLVQIWEDLLGVRPIGIKDNFFDLGGHSLLAALLIDRIAQVCGKKLPLSTLFAGATIEHLATALMGEVKIDSRTPLVTVQAGGSRRPFFFLHGQWTGGAFYSMELARYLGPDQPFYLLEPYKFDGLQVPPTFETMAATHIEALRSVQPEGPYLLGGWCNGGLIAYEMARQLHAQGQSVDLLVLMDPDPPAPQKWERRIIVGLGKLLRHSQEKQVDWFLSYRYLRLSFYYWRLNKLKHMRVAKQGEPEFERSAVDAVPPHHGAVIPSNEILRQDWSAIYDWVASGYLPHSYPGKIMFFWTDEEPLRRERWRKLIDAKTKANEVEVHIIPGNHITSRTQYLPVLAEQLRLCLSKAQSTLLS